MGEGMKNQQLVVLPDHNENRRWNWGKNHESSFSYFLAGFLEHYNSLKYQWQRRHTNTHQNLWILVSRSKQARGTRCVAGYLLTVITTCRY